MNIDKLKKVIQASNPSIMELNIFCNNHSCNHNEPIKEKHCWCCGEDSWREEHIIRPITLADVLIAMGKNGHQIEEQVVTNKGIDFSINRKWTRWNLKDNNLDNQSPETLKFLTKLLVK